MENEQSFYYQFKKYLRIFAEGWWPSGAKQYYI